jgi:hypothetical protein
MTLARRCLIKRRDNWIESTMPHSLSIPQSADAHARLGRRSAARIVASPFHHIVQIDLRSPGKWAENAGSNDI